MVLNFCDHNGFTFRDVEIEEVAVEDSLDATGDYSDQVEESLEVETVHPVENVQGAVRS